jgi:hypothetical protein
MGIIQYDRNIRQTEGYNENAIYRDDHPPSGAEEVIEVLENDDPAAISLLDVHPFCHLGHHL